MRLTTPPAPTRTPDSTTARPILTSAITSVLQSAANPSSRPVSPALRDLEPRMAHHRPTFVHASTSAQVPLASPGITPPVLQPLSAHSHSEYPAEKDTPPDYAHIVEEEEYDPRFGAPFNPYNHASRHHGHHAFAHASRASSRRSSVIPVAPEPCMLHNIRDKLLGKEGGMGRALMLGWVGTTLGFIIATAFWKGQLFGALDRLSKNLYAMGLEGKLIFTFLIFITTIPPLPLYSTLMVLAGYTFGVWEGFVVSYIASIVGAVLVFIVSRTLLRDVITKSLSSSPTAQSLLAIIPANPHLLLLIRIAPYPYNLLNVILASAPSLTLRTYTACTAISLLKLVLHTWIGAGIHDITSFGASHPPPGSGDPSGPIPDGSVNEGQWEPPYGSGSGGGAGRHGDHRPPWGSHGYGGQGRHAWHAAQRHRAHVRMYSTWIGIGLCVGLFFYLTHLAKKALKKAQEEEALRREGEEMLSGSEEEC